MKIIETEKSRIIIEDDAIEEAEELYICEDGCHKDWIVEELIPWGFPKNKNCPNCGDKLTKLSDLS